MPPMVDAIRHTTAAELLAMPDDGLRRELVRGELRAVSPAGHEHGSVAALLLTSLTQHVCAHALGRTYAAETGFWIARDPDTVRAPDAAFVTADRAAAAGVGPGFFEGAPDLAAEVVSPTDTFSDVEDEALTWLAAGTAMVLVVDPRHRTVTVYRSRDDIRLLCGDDDLDGADVVPGWTLPLADLFGDRPQSPDEA